MCRLRLGFVSPFEAVGVEVKGCLRLYVFWLPLLYSMDWCRRVVVDMVHRCYLLGWLSELEAA